MRLDRFISNTTDHSRKSVKALLRQGLVRVDGTTVSDPALKVRPGQTVTIADETVAPAGPRYFMLHKPLGYVCATRDNRHPTVIDLLDEPNKDKLQIAGRLDIDTTGLVLITDDGQWNHAVTSPRRACHKVYRVETADNISPDTSVRFSRGVLLDGERQRTRPATLELLYANEALLTLQEGKYHQVKRMFAAMGNRVTALHRESVGAITLDPDLEEGEYRPLTPCEISSVTLSAEHSNPLSKTEN
ncbi:MAG: 16S rRNA pseudouridine(516) synthase RsuA [Porticoccaceae bacterium]|nr:16S rRNA pseudouridine(516) synthase RsuA [Porticoccaceae bacterium]